MQTLEIGLTALINNMDNYFYNSAEILFSLYQVSRGLLYFKEFSSPSSVLAQVMMFYFHFSMSDQSKGEDLHDIA
jgi:hypothetical protein